MFRVNDVVFYTENGENDSGTIISIDNESDWPYAVEFSDGIDHYQAGQLTLLTNAPE